MTLDELLEAVAASYVVSDVAPLPDVYLRMDRELWHAISAWAQRRAGKPICPRCRGAIEPGTRHVMFNGNQMFACVAEPV